MFYVCTIRSKKFKKYYTDFFQNIEQRLKEKHYKSGNEREKLKDLRKKN